MTRKFLLIFLTPLFFTSTLLSQEWMDGNLSPSDNPNFYEIQENFNNYWKDKEIGKGKGYKQFKRWEWYWEQRVYEDGSFPPAGINLTEFNKYLRDYSQDNRSMVGEWTSLGPNSTTGGYAGTGRINSVAFHPTNENIIYIGAAGGGIWKTTDGGSSWTPLSDNIGSLGVSAIIVHPTNPNIIYIGTGDGDASDNYSVGVLKSTDGGTTWNETGLDWNTSNTKLIRNMVLDPDNYNRILAATNDGIWRTNDAGVNWTQEISGNFYDIEINPNKTTGIFYACKSNEIFKSSDSGDSWTSVHSVSGSNRIALATTEADDTYVYALSSKSSGSGFNALLKSTDSGSTFTSQSTTPNILGWNTTGSDSNGQGWYDLVITADPLDAETIYTGGVNTWKSTDGGINWNIVTMWYSGTGVPAVHADKHAMEWQNNTTLWQGNDGGIYKTTDGGTSWSDKTSDLVISQMYRISASQTDERVIAGLQDNGTKLKNTNGSWSDEIGGDGMDCAINPSNSDVMYGELYYGDIRRNTNGGVGGWTDIQNNIPGNPSGGWITPFVLSPSDPSIIVAGFKDVYRSLNQGDTWTTIGSGLTTSNLSFVAVAPSDANYIYVGRNNQLWSTSDAGANWNTLSGPGSNTSKLIVNPSNPEILYATRTNYSSGNKVYKSIDGGANWTNISGTLPNIPANSIAFHNDGDETLYVAMDVGVYYRNNTMGDWVLYNTDLPNVEISDIEVKEDTNEIVVGTYGRGVWKADAIGVSLICKTPISLTSSNVTYDSADLSWTAPNTAPSNGYEWAVTTSLNVPQSGTDETGLTISVDNLMSGTAYYLHVRSDCDNGLYSAWATHGPFITKYDCGDTFYDTGGLNSDYGDSEDITTTICPSVPDNSIVFTFNDFGVEVNWDALYVYNGNSTTSPLFGSGNGATQAGYPAGGYYGFTNPGPFYSTDTTGCLTVRFRSDGYVTELGWDVDVTCDILCSDEVTNKNDDGWGSLRRTIACAEPGATININSDIYGDTIVLNSPITIDKDVNLNMDMSSIVYLKAINSGPIFNVEDTGTLELNYVYLIAGNQLNGRAIINDGTLNLNNVNIYDFEGSSGSGSMIINNGSIEINGASNLYKDQ